MGFALHLILAAAQLGAATDPSSLRPDREEYDGSAGEIDVETPYVEGPTIEVDGLLDEAHWGDAALLHRFTQYDPIENIAATQRTEVLVFVSEDALYFGIRAFDDDPGGLRASIPERDNVVRRDDYVRITLDTFNDSRRAYVFVVNPFGVQQDGIWLEGRESRRGGGFGPPIDYNPDFLWDSEGRREEWGYQVELRIPFKSLRFPEADLQSWGLQAMRRIERFGYEESWAPISTNEVNQLAQSGRLGALRGLDPGLFLELNPVITGSLQGSLDDTDAFGHADPQGEFGLNATYGVTSNLTLDATFNPDFSQVEADAGQIAVNERFALFFEEQRPFFLEGTEIFNLPKQLVYTRSIVDPIAGAKLTGKVGGFTVGYLGALDEATVVEDYARVNILRLRRDVGQTSNVGLLFADRSESGDVFNRIVAGDARLVLRRRYALTLLGALSSTSLEGAEAETGPMWSAKFERSGRGFSFSGEIEDVAHEFDAQSGFINRVGDTQVNSQVQYSWYGRSGAVLEQVVPQVQLRGFWDHDAFWDGRSWEEHELELSTRFSFVGNTTVNFSYFRGGFAPPPSGYDGLFAETDPDVLEPIALDASLFEGLDGFRIWLYLARWEQLRGRFVTEIRQVPLFDPSLRVPVEAANSWSVDGNFTLYPTASLAIELGLRHVTLSRQATEERYSSVSIYRTRAQYQLSKSLFVRGIMEFQEEDIGPLMDPAGRVLRYCEDGECTVRDASDGRDLYLEGLISYEPSPGTVFFAGYSRSYDNVSVLVNPRRLSPTADGLFLKVSYRFRY